MKDVLKSIYSTLYSGETARAEQNQKDSIMYEKMVQDGRMDRKFADYLIKNATTGRFGKLGEWLGGK